MAAGDDPDEVEPGGPRYAVVPIVRRADGLGPDIPEEVGFLELAEPVVGASSYALYRLDVPEAVVVPKAQAVPEDIEVLIWSGEGFPPALAQARDAVALGSGAEPRPDDFLRRFGGHLTELLSAQRGSQAFLARCVEGQPGYLTPGAWYWLLDRTEDGSRVRWVSSDYHVYTDPTSTFDVRPDLVLRLPLA
jgi:hypothetical protein